MNNDPFRIFMDSSDLSDRRLASIGTSSKFIATFLVWMAAANCGQTIVLNDAKPVRTFSQFQDLLLRCFTVNWIGTAELALFSLLAVYLVHRNDRLALPFLLLRAVLFGFLGGVAAMLLPAMESMISADSSFRILRWFGRKPFWITVALVTSIQLIFELAVLAHTRLFKRGALGAIVQPDQRNGQH